MLIIYGRKSSANVQKVHWICSEGSLEFKYINVGGKYGGHTSQEFKEMNPNCTIPVLKDDDFIIYESNAIIKYISEKFNIFKINKKKEIALVNQWIDWSSLILGLQCATYTAHSLLLPSHKRNLSTAKETKEQIYLTLKILDDQLKKNEFIVTDKISLADIPIGCWVNRCVVLNLNISQFPYLKKWYYKLKDRNAFFSAVVSSPLPPN